jgi:hypothetical protein
MNAGRAERIEGVVDAGAAALFALAAGYTAFAFIATAEATAGSAMLAFFAIFAGLRLVRAPHPGFALGEFTLGEVPVEEAAELILTEADLLRPPAAELVLDDALPQPAADSRVVQLFDRTAMPAPGGLQSRIDCHFRNASPPNSSPDASQSLQQALAELRRSLR